MSNFKKLLSVCMFLCVSSVLAAPSTSPWGKDYFPNIELTDQDGKKVHFYDDLIKDKVVAINFIFTHCSDSCPAETASLKQVYKLLGDRVGKDIFFYSISIDPKHDTPKVLKEYAKKFNINTNAGWTFLTGSKKDVTLLRTALGLYRTGDTLGDHMASFMVGNESTGQWAKRSPFDEPKVLARQLGNVFSRYGTYKNPDLVSYDQATKIDKMGKGEETFRYRCASCHNLSNENGIGPGLQNVTQIRDRSWLTKWIKTPDKLLADKDPIAVDLYNKYNQVIMPNLRLTDVEVEDVLNYLVKHTTQ